jgi:tetratricopeptide (TPR) repeat protein
VHPQDALTFRWPANAAAAKYRLEFQPALGGKKVYVVDKNEMSYAGPLNRAKYTWQVTAVVDGTETRVTNTPRAFGVLRRSEVDTADAVQAMEQSEDPGSIAVAALVYEELNLFSRAVGCYEKLVKLTPDAARAYAALAELYGKMGRTSDSKHMRDAAERLGYSFADK